jgi:fucose 4-O-acetylase-like acetyltransferase
MAEATLRVGATSGPRLDELVAATPSSRDRYVDFLRALSITVVVVGHWIGTLVGWENGAITVHNVVGLIPGLWYSTWVLQVLPLFFFVGGFSNFTAVGNTLRRGESIGAFMRSRLVRLLKPTAVFVVVWLVVLVALRAAGMLKPAYMKAALLLFGPLWFLLVYLILTALTPVMRILHLRFGIAVVAVMVSLAVGVDVFRFALRAPAFGWANFAFVWLLAHQLGFFYADGTLTRVRRGVHLAIALVGLAGVFFLTHLGSYPKSMVGTGYERVSNMTPPTACILSLTFWLVGASMFLRGWANRWLANPGPWKAVVAANSMIMTVYLWHLTAYAAAYGLLSAVGFTGSPAGSGRWWLERSVWLVGPGLALALLILLFRRFEHPTLRPRPATA